MGRLCGGLTANIHAFADAGDRPIHLRRTAGQTHEGAPAADMFATLATGQVLRVMAMRGVIADIRLLPTR